MARRVSKPSRETFSATANKERDDRQKVTLRQAIFAYEDEMGVERRARRGAVIYVNDRDYERGMNGGAFVEGFQGNVIGIQTPQMYPKGQPPDALQHGVEATPLPDQIEVLEQQLAEMRRQAELALEPSVPTGPVGTTEGGLAIGVSVPTNADGSPIGTEVQSDLAGMSDDELAKFVAENNVQTVTESLVTDEDADRVLAAEEKTTNGDPRKTLVTNVQAHKAALLAAEENDPDSEPEDLGGPGDPDNNEGQG
jgi:hypothetical protein